MFSSFNLGLHDISPRLYCFSNSINLLMKIIVIKRERERESGCEEKGGGTSPEFKPMKALVRYI